MDASSLWPRLTQHLAVDTPVLTLLTNPSHRALSFCYQAQPKVPIMRACLLQGEVLLLSVAPEDRSMDFFCNISLAIIFV